jgi:hypothetical protein
MAGTVPVRRPGTLIRVAAKAATLWAAVVLLAVEAVGIAAVAGFLLYENLTATAAFRSGAWAMTVLAALATVGVALLARALIRRRSWARNPAIFLELMLLPIGYYMVKGGLAWQGVLVLALGLAGAGLLVSPATRDALGIK